VAEDVQGWASIDEGVTGGAGGTEVLVTDVETLIAEAGTGEKIIYVSGNLGDDTTENSNNIRVASNTTIHGLPGNQINAWFTINQVSNVILRNLTIVGPGADDVDGPDAVNISGATHVWVDHCDISDGQDGNLDIVNQANYITISWTRFSYSSRSLNHQYCNLIGNSDSKTSDEGHLKTTLYKNWWDEGVAERMPRVRFGEVHVVNNLYTSMASNYCIRAGRNANILIESNLFRRVNDPIDLYDGDYTAVEEKNNDFTNSRGGMSGDGTAFVPPYDMTIDPVDTIEAPIQQCAGASLPDPR
jgi:pectate lyase